LIKAGGPFVARNLWHGANVKHKPVFVVSLLDSTRVILEYTSVYLEESKDWISLKGRLEGFVARLAEKVD
jgi:hypothetical protein